MVQYVFTPWRDRQELLLVRQQFYGPSSPTPAIAETWSSSSTTTTRIRTREGGRPSISAAVGGLTTASVIGGHDHDDRDDDAHARGVKAGAGAGASAGPCEGGQSQRDQHHAVARVSMWMQRGSCPHMVESTALLMAAVLSDERSSAMENAASSTYAVRAAYSAAFSRFVTGLLDGHQDKLRKQSMYSIAKTIGLPATFVELRHQATHEQLPSLARLRSAAKKALLWIWDYYWKHLPPLDEAATDDGKLAESPHRELIMAYLREDDEAASVKLIGQLRRQRDLERVLRTVAELQDTLLGNKVYLKCLRLSKELMMAMTANAAASKDGATTESEATARVTTTTLTMSQDNEELEVTDTGDNHSATDRASKGPETSELDTGWSLYSGDWKPKPIGVV